MTDTTYRGFGGADPVTVGAQLAIERLERYGVYRDMDLEDVTYFVRSALESTLAGSVPERAVEMMAEQVTIAALIRREYREPDLTEADVQIYLDFASSFFNSLWHDTP